MFRRTLATALVLGLLASPSAALAQSTQQQPPGGAFGPLPQSGPSETPTPTPDQSDDSLTSDLGGITTLWIIGGGLLLAFIAIGVFISRDARSALPEHHRPGTRLREEGPHKHKREAKARARARGKAQKAARRRNR
jgi:hypothetical protein